MLICGTANSDFGIELITLAPFAPNFVLRLCLSTVTRQRGRST